MTDIQTAVETWMSRLSEPEWRTLVARVREPDEAQIPKGASGGQED
jgi:hypothetical protein